MDERYHYIEGAEARALRHRPGPGQLTDLVGARGEVARSRQKRLADFPAASVAPGEVGREELEKLAALGYLGGAVGATSGPPPDPRESIHVLRDVKAAFRLAAAGRDEEAVSVFRKILVQYPLPGRCPLRAGPDPRTPRPRHRGLRRVQGHAADGAVPGRARRPRVGPRLPQAGAAGRGARPTRGSACAATPPRGTSSWPGRARPRQPRRGRARGPGGERRRRRGAGRGRSAGRGARSVRSVSPRRSPSPTRRSARFGRSGSLRCRISTSCVATPSRGSGATPRPRRRSRRRSAAFPATRRPTPGSPSCTASSAGRSKDVDRLLEAMVAANPSARRSSSRPKRSSPWEMHRGARVAPPLALAVFGPLALTRSLGRSKLRISGIPQRWTACSIQWTKAQVVWIYFNLMDLLS